MELGNGVEFVEWSRVFLKWSSPKQAHSMVRCRAHQEVSDELGKASHCAALTKTRSSRSLVGLGVQAIQEREFDDLKLFKSIIKEGAKPKV